MARYFFYCPETTKDVVLRAFSATRGYQAIALTNDDEDFWNRLPGLNENSNLVILSHGARNDGPNLHKGDGGNASFTEENTQEFCETLERLKLDFYCLSCNTGRDGEFLKLMKQFGGSMIAPRDYARVSQQGILKIESVKVCKQCIKEFHGPPPNNVCPFGNPSSKCCGESKWGRTGPRQFGRISGATLRIKD